MQKQVDLLQQKTGELTADNAELRRHASILESERDCATADFLGSKCMIEDLQSALSQARLQHTVQPLPRCRAWTGRPTIYLPFACTEAIFVDAFLSALPSSGAVKHLTPWPLYAQRILAGARAE